jgi:hypothetical protein
VILTPVHQFEIRFTTILNFSDVVRPVIAPFVKLADRISIDDENFHSEKITLFFDDEFYQIFILWDRIVFKCEKFSIANLIHNNSPIEEPFFNLYNKISQLTEFGNVNNLLFFSFYVNVGTSDNFEEIRNKFIEDNIVKNSCTSLMSGISDVGIVLDAKEEDGSVMTIISGPYLGYDDIKKRNFNIRDKKLIDELQNAGEIIDFKYFKQTKTANYSLYKEIFRKAEAIIRQKWEK